MEEVGARVASPAVTRQMPAQRFCNSHPVVKKRGLPLHPSNIGHQNPSDNWNPKSWDWDSAKFVAKPALQCDGGARVGNQHSGKDDSNLQMNITDGDGSKGGLNMVEEPQTASRPNKRVRSGSPGGSGNYPMCQVDDCEEDLSKAKDYHRRHKVCEVHSKATNALVGKQMQRFCQQCSRFHPLSEFDEGKRSCRRRLAGHNRRRRKTTQPEESNPRVLLPGSPNKNINCDVNVINLLAVLAHAQGNTRDESDKSPLLPEKDNLMKLLSKINSLPLPANLASKLPLPKSTSTSISNHAPSEKYQNQKGENASCPSTMDLLAVLSGPPSSDAETQSHPSTEASDSERSKSIARVDQDPSHIFPKGPIGGEISSRGCHSLMKDASPGLQLHLFSSSPEDMSSRKFPLGGNYVSSNSSNHSEERSSPVSSSTPPLVHNLFPMQTSRETMKDKNAHLSNSDDEIAYVKSNLSNNGCSTSLHLYGGPVQVNENGSIQSSPHRTGYASSSGSDHSPSSLNSDVQDRTGRIIFKLFEKDPSHLPESLRNQIYNWLKSSPSEMESYIRPGCIVFSLYLSMPSFAWNQLEKNFLSYVVSLVKDIDVGFWGNGRFLVYTDTQMASHKDGKTRLYKSWRDWTTPELTSVSPVAVVGGQETSLLLRGRSLTAPGTTIHCTHADGYSIVASPSCKATGQDEIRLSSFKICEAASEMIGRCFIEVEHSFRGISFPVIIADNTICNELRLLEPVIDGTAEFCDSISSNTGKSWSRLEVLHFLDELGWLFQRKSNSSLFGIPSYKLSRFKFLVIFSAEHDFCALVKTLLDILLELSLGRTGLAQESLAMLSEIHLLNRAVRRKCRSMVNLLVNYSVTDYDGSSQKFIFQPDLAGAGGLTPLHLAACISSSDDIVDALTNDPQAVGLQSWNSALDVNGLSPYAYAAMRNNHQYNVLIARKLDDWENGQISVSVDDEVKMFHVESNNCVPRLSPCQKCAAVAAHAYRKRFPGSHGLLQRPYIHSMLVIAAVCVCVCLVLRGHPSTNHCWARPFLWENVPYGSI